MLQVINNILIDSKGNELKRINCPKNLKTSDISESNKPFFDCNKCNKTIVNTAFLSEENIIKIVSEDPSVCLALHKNNPKIRFN